MKQTAAAIILAIAVCLVGCNGCKSNNIQVIRNDNVVTNTVPVRAFNDETYVWENWTIGTNSVKSLEK